MRPEDLIAVALLYVELNGLKRIRQANLRRALSTAYFALFHAICLCCRRSMDWRE